MTDSAAGWQPDPTGRHEHRYWDGTGWTDNVADGGVAATDAYEGPVAGADDPTVVGSPEPAPDPTATQPAMSDPADQTLAQPVVPEATEPATEPMPVPGDTAAFPSTPTPPAPPPYVPPTPAAGAGGGGDDGSKRKLLIGGGILAVIAIAVIALLALGGDDDGPDVRAQLASKLQETAGDEGADLSDADAACLADYVVGELGEDAFDDVDFSADEAPPEIEQALTTAGLAAIEKCEIDLSAFGGGDGGATDDTTETTEGGDDLAALQEACAGGDFPSCDSLYFQADVGSDLEEFGSTCGGTADEQSGFCEETNGGEDALSTDGATGGLPDGGFEEIIADTYEQSFGLDRDKAECLASRMADVVESGELSEEDAMTQIFDYLEDCDISMEELSGTSN